MSNLIPRISPTSLNSLTKYSGHIHFHYPKIYHEKLGTFSIKGKFNRIEPNLKTSFLPEEHIAQTGRKLLDWATGLGLEKNYSPNRPSVNNLDKVGLNCARFGLYMYPTEKRRESLFLLYFMMIAFIYDDPLEDGWSTGAISKDTLGQLRYIHNALLRVLKRELIPDYDTVPQFPMFPVFHLLLRCFEDLVKLGEEIVRGDYPYEVLPFARAVQRWFESNEWFAANKMDRRYSVGSMVSWRNLNVGAEACIEGAAFASQCKVSLEIRNHPAFVKLVGLMSNNLHRGNDLLGMKKDFVNGGDDPDNELIFRSVHKGQRIEEAVDEVTKIMDEELRDLDLQKEALVNIFGRDEHLLHYFDLMDTHIDGQFYAYVNNKRYGLTKENLVLTRHVGLGMEEVDEQEINSW